VPRVDPGAQMNIPDYFSSVQEAKSVVIVQNYSGPVVRAFAPGHV
jgi:hypothetical protein